MFRWVSVAPLGKPVVPDVYWMLIGSSGRSCGLPLGQRRRVGTSSAAAHSASHSGDQKKIVRSRSGTSGRTSSTMAT